MLRRILRSAFVNTYTWQIEAFVVFASLLAVILLSKGGWIEYIGSFAVVLTFLHAQVSDRMSEAQARMPEPSVECFRWAGRYYVLKELLWLSYFVLLHAWSALVGVAVFLLYPLWRQYYKKANPEIYVMTREFSELKK